MLAKLKWLLSEYKLYEEKKTLQAQAMFFLFIAGGVVGFVWEEIFCIFENGTITWRGFLYGPILPIYGFGALLIYIFLRHQYRRPWVVFLASGALSAVGEYLTGWIIHEVTGHYMWYYGGWFLNLNGYICFLSVGAFAIMSLVCVYLIEPIVFRIVCVKMRPKTRKVLIIILAIVLVLDCTMVAIFPNHLGAVDETGFRIHLK